MKVIVLEELDFMWSEEDLMQLAKMWEQEESIETMSRQFERDPDEIILALMHLAKQDKIRPRKVGLLGRR